MKILPTPEVFCSDNALEELPVILKNMSAAKVMVVTDKGIIGAGIYDKIKAILDTTNIEIILCDEVKPDPSITLVKSIAELARKSDVSAIIGLGGGSSLDTAKVAAAMVTNDKDLDAYIGINLLEKMPLPIIAIPTTAGTGSEVTHIAILSDEEEQLKKGIVSPKIIPSYAILDPNLTVGLPPHITAATGMDALCHALEAYTSIGANRSVYSDSLALKAIEMITANLKIAYNEGSNLEARRNMLLGSLLAGMAFANAGVTAVHAFAYPLGGMFHVPHGLANSLMLPVIVEYNQVGNEERFIEVGKHMANARKDNTTQATVDAINELSNELKIPKNLAEVNIPEDAIQSMAEGAIKVTRLLDNNPRPITLDDAVNLYTQAYNR
ncbi:MAG: iron-containing alcohol dehydrogenase [Planctomycetes bacterium]|nr:iron-containing alcohol dehydrogenase [Planctomycetota bacterium]